MRFLYIFSAWVILLIFSESCKGPDAPKEDRRKKTALETFSIQSAEIIPGITNPADIANLLEITAASYQPELVHDPLDWSEYRNNTLFAAANFGIYMADAIYQYAFDMTEDAYLSWMASHSLAEVLGFANIFDDVVIKRMQGELTSKDSLFHQIDKALKQMGTEYTEIDKFRMYTALLTGNYIEKVHLVMGTLWNNASDIPEETKLLLHRELFLVLLGQLESVKDLISLIERYETLDDPGFLALELKKIRDIYYSINISTDNLGQITPEQIINNNRIIALQNHLENVRNFLIRGVSAE
jgi:hypothetical protein